MEDLQIMMAKLGLLAARAKFNRVAANVPKEKIDAILDPLEGKMWKKYIMLSICLIINKSSKK